MNRRLMRKRQDGTEQGAAQQTAVVDRATSGWGVPVSVQETHGAEPISEGEQAESAHGGHDFGAFRLRPPHPSAGVPEGGLGRSDYSPVPPQSLPWSLPRPPISSVGAFSLPALGASLGGAEGAAPVAEVESPARAVPAAQFGHSFSAMAVSAAPPPASAGAAPVIQASLTVSAPGDRYEREADQAAEMVMRSPSSATPPAEEDEGASDVGAEQIQLSRVEDGAAGVGGVSPQVEQGVRGLRGGGQPLPPGERQFFESRFGHDFSQVRIHTDARAAGLSNDLNAHAFTVGQDIAFGAGGYAPGTDAGRRLIAHELTHVVQQGGAQVSRHLVQRFRKPETVEDAVTQAQEQGADVPDESVGAIEIATSEVALQEPAASGGGESGGGGGGGAAVPPSAAQETQTATPQPAPTAPQAVPTPAAPALQSAPTEANAATEIPQSALAIVPVPAGAKSAPKAAPAGNSSVAHSPSPSPASTPQPKAEPAPTNAENSAQPGTALAAPTAGTSGATVPATPAPASPAVTAPSTSPAPLAGSASPAGVVPTAELASGTSPTPTAASASPASPASPASVIADSPKAALAAPPASAVPAGAGAAANGAVPAASAPPRAPAQATIPAAPSADATQAKPSNAAAPAAAPAATAASVDKAPTSPAEDPAFQGVVARGQQVAGQERTHKPAQGESVAAQAAADPKGSDVTMAAQDNQVGEMESQPPGTFDAAAFKAKLMERIKQEAPDTQEKAAEFKKNNQLGTVKNELSNQVKEEKKDAAGPVEEKTKEAPSTSGIKAKEVRALPKASPGRRPAPIGAAAAAPKPKTDSEAVTPFRENSREVDQQMANADVTEDQLRNSDEPSFTKALDTKKEAQKDAAERPQQYRQQEQGVLKQAQADAEKTSDQKTTEMHSEREKLLAQVFGIQGTTKTTDEGERKQVAEQIAGYYEKTKSDVEKILSDLSTWVENEFDQAATKAQKSFEDYVDKQMRDYKDRRYSGLDGPILWVRDRFRSLPDEVNRFYEQGRDQYIADVDNALTGIANHVALELNRAKQRITQGKQDIQKYVSTLPASLRKVGQEAAGQIAGKFDELEQSVDNKQDELIDTLAQKYSEKLQAVDARIEEMKQANRGLIDKALDAIGSVIRTIIELKDLLLGVLARAASVIGSILSSPGKFFGNLVASLKQGFNGFVANIGKHLQDGLLEWLTGTMSASGIKLPKSLDMAGIFDLVLQVLGLTYDQIRAQVVKALGPRGEEIVGGLEKTWDVFKKIQSEGLAGLWELVKDQVGDLKVMVMDQIERLIQEEIVKAGINWLLSLVGGPLTGLIKIAQTIVKLVSWFLNNAGRIAALINAILDSMASIASGDIGGAAKMVEDALAKGLSLAISFLASLLNLGDIPKRVQKVIAAVRRPINKAIEWVVKKAVGLARGAMGMLKGGKGKGAQEGKAHGRSLKGGKGKGAREGKEHERSLKGGRGKGLDGPDERTIEQKRADVNAATQEAESILSREDITPDVVRKELEPIKSKYRLTSIELMQDGAFAYAVKASINPDSTTEYRALFKLVDEPKRKVKSDGSTEIEYETSGGQKFKTTLDSDGMIKSISSTNLRLKPSEWAGQQGHVSTPVGFLSNAGMNRSHLIADMFGGSGYKKALNIVATSDHYNKTVMRNAEREIEYFVKDEEATSFDMDVSVTWGELNIEGVKRCIRADLLNKNPKLKGREDKIKKKVDKIISKIDSRLKNCMGVIYKVVIDKGNNKIDQTFEIGPDEWYVA